MKFINIMGPIQDMDRVIGKYISQYEIQLEYAWKELYQINELEQFTGSNPYAAEYGKVKLLEEKLPSFKFPVDENWKLAEAFDIVDKACAFVEEQNTELNQITNLLSELDEMIGLFTIYKNMDFKLEQLYQFTYTKFRFGKMPIGSYKQFEAYLHDNPEMIFVEGIRNNEYIWGIYFVPRKKAEKIDSIFASLHFERIYVPEEFSDLALNESPSEVVLSLLDRRRVLMEKKAELEITSLDKIGIHIEELIAACAMVKKVYSQFDCRKYAAKTRQDYYIFVGWMLESDANELEKQIHEDPSVMFLPEEDNISISSKPPTKLKNPKLFKPFEMLVKMYGMPSYNEIDPTIFVAITYTLFFGMMFGDLGQGIVLAVLGFILYGTTKIPLTGVMGICGCSSMIFGTLYGSVFGFEELLPTIWLSPAHDVLDILIISICFGAVCMLLCMVFNIINGIKKKKVPELIFSQNGVCGLAFYGFALIFIALNLTGIMRFSYSAIALILCVPLLLIGFKEPLIAIMKKKKRKKTGIGMFILETFMELFEVLLSYFTNTVSFVRAGGFAISHAGLMSAVMLLASSNGESLNLPIVVIGNILVMCIEGLVVGIQVMRLQYYELFSRYYEGGGQEFIAYRGFHN